MSAEIMLRPPVNHAMRTLDRSFFQKQIDLSAARIFNPKDIGLARKLLIQGKQLFQAKLVNRIPPIRLDPTPGSSKDGRKCILLQPEVKHNDPTTWCPSLAAMVSDNKASVIPYRLDLDYTSWDYHDIMTAILPESMHHDFATGYTTVGHIAHLNLREPMLPYKHILANVLMDKNPHIRTVINKTSNVGHTRPYEGSSTPADGTSDACQRSLEPRSNVASDRPGLEAEDVDDEGSRPFRTFAYEVLAGDDDMVVTHKESECTFRFDYSQVYWNTRLSTEHDRLMQLFRPGSAVCDACAGVGPFVIPAAKNRRVLVWANDLNPTCYIALRENAERNSVTPFFRAIANTDARDFVRSATRDLWERAARSETVKVSASSKTKSSPKSDSKSKTRGQPKKENLPLPRTFSHFVLNLPATATTFLPAFRGLFTQHPTFANLTQELSTSKLSREQLLPMPLVHVYCFARKGDIREDGIAEEAVREVSAELGAELTVKWGPPGADGSTEPDAPFTDDIIPPPQADTQKQAQTDLDWLINKAKRTSGIETNTSLPPSHHPSAQLQRTPSPPSSFSHPTNLSTTPSPRHPVAADAESGQGLDWLADSEAYVHDVRDVAPKKSMLCVSFRLPERVAFWEERGPRETSSSSLGELKEKWGLK